MATAAMPELPLPSDPFPRLLRAGIVTGISDGLFAVILSVFVFHITVMRLWQGVAAVLLGKDALNGGVTTELIGVAMHFTVAFTWSAIFLFVVMRSAAVRRMLASPNGVLKMAAVYGPFIWLVMSLIVVPVLAHKPWNITDRWWIQLVGHVPFVAFPMITMLTRR
jgi:hypothetical protein